MEFNHCICQGMQEEFALVLKLTFDTNTIYIVIYWAKIVFSLCLQRDISADRRGAPRGAGPLATAKTAKKLIRRSKRSIKEQSLRIEFVL